MILSFSKLQRLGVEYLTFGEIRESWVELAACSKSSSSAIVHPPFLFSWMNYMKVSLSAGEGSGDFWRRENLVTVGYLPITPCSKLPGALLILDPSCTGKNWLVLWFWTLDIFLHLLGQHLSMPLLSLFLFWNPGAKKQNKTTQHPFQRNGYQQMLHFVKSKWNHEIFYSLDLPGLASLKTILKIPLKIQPTVQGKPQKPVQTSMFIFRHTSACPA